MRVLTVDDSRTIRKLASATIESLGYEALQAENGVDALAVLREEASEVNLILMDWNMPEMDGFDCLQRVVSDEALSRIPVMMVTTESQASQVAKALRAGAVNYLTKPFTPEQLALKILECFGEADPVDVMGELRGNRETPPEIREAFLEASQEAIVGMAMMAVETEGIKAPPDAWPSAELDVRAELAFGGERTGRLCLGLSLDLASEIVAAMMGEEPQALSDAEVADGAGELANMIGGAAKAKLASAGIAFDLSVPSVSIGEQPYALEPGGFSARCRIAGRSMRLDVWL
jgi:two-component system chemotaxis response regulator CheY